MKKKKCPICKKMVDPSWIQPTSVPMVVNGRKLKREFKGMMLSECCATIYLSSEALMQENISIDRIRETSQDGSISLSEDFSNGL